MSEQLGTGDHGRFIIAPDLYSDPAHRAAATAFTAYITANPPDGVIIVVAAGVDPVTVATAIEDLRTHYRGPILLLYSGRIYSQLHRDCGLPAHPAKLATSPADTVDSTGDGTQLEDGTANCLHIWLWTLHHPCRTGAGRNHQVDEHRRYEPLDVQQRFASQQADGQSSSCPDVVHQDESPRRAR